MRRVRFGAVGSLLVASAAWSAMVGCGGSVTDVPTDLPAQLALRSDTPYIIGTIIKREVVTGGVVRLLVRAGDSDFSRVSQALVTVRHDALLLWPDGSAASLDALRLGRHVMVFTNGPELRSLPPQVSGDAILLVR